MDQYLTWTFLATYGGALAMVTLLTQFTKELGFIDKMPTQLWSYILSLAVLFPAMYFTGQLTTEMIFLTFFNGVIVSLGSNGGYNAVNRIRDIMASNASFK